MIFDKIHQIQGSNTNTVQDSSFVAWSNQSPGVPGSNPIASYIFFLGAHIFSDPNRSNSWDNDNINVITASKKTYIKKIQMTNIMNMSNLSCKRSIKPNLFFVKLRRKLNTSTKQTTHAVCFFSCSAMEKVYLLKDPFSEQRGCIVLGSHCVSCEKSVCVGHVSIV